MRPYTEQDDKIIKKYAGVKTTSDIAVMLGRSRAGLAQYANASGISMKQIGQHHYNSKLTDADVDKILLLDSRGVFGADIHRDHFSHLNRATIYDVLECNTWRHK